MNFYNCCVLATLAETDEKYDMASRQYIVVVSAAAELRSENDEAYVAYIYIYIPCTHSHHIVYYILVLEQRQSHSHSPISERERLSEYCCASSTSPFAAQKSQLLRVQTKRRRCRRPCMRSATRECVCLCVQCTHTKDKNDQSGSPAVNPNKLPHRCV